MCSGARKGQVKHANTSMNADNTIKAIKNVVVLCYNEAKSINARRKFELECDNARPQASKKTQSIMNGRECLPHHPLGGHPMNAKAGRLPNLPDSCLTEHIFNDWTVAVYKRKPQTVVELKKIAEDE